MSFERTRAGRALAILATAALLVTGLTVSPAAADHDRNGPNRGERDGRYTEDGHPGRGHGHAEHHDRNYHRRGYAFPYAAYERHSHYRHHARHAARASYFCRPCHEHFGSRRHFERHLAHHHHVPLPRLSHVIVFSALGWIFQG